MAPADPVTTTKYDVADDGGISTFNAFDDLFFIGVIDDDDDDDVDDDISFDKVE